MNPLIFFLGKCDSEQFLFEVFFYVISIFCSVEPKSDSTFRFQYNMWILPEKHVLALNVISQPEVFNVWLSHSRVLLGRFHWKLGSISFIQPRIKIECVWFFCNLFCGITRRSLWFVNMMLFHSRNYTHNKIIICSIQNKDSFGIGDRLVMKQMNRTGRFRRDKIHNTGWTKCLVLIMGNQWST